MRTSTRSMRRSSSATIRDCAAARDRGRRGRAGGELRGQGARGAHGHGRAQARRLCPDAIVVRPRMEAYSEASKAVFAIFEETTPLVEGISIDEAFLDVRGMRRIAGTPRDMAARLRGRVREQVGLPITVGIARTKFLAKVASRVAKPDGLLEVPPERELAWLHRLPVELLWGVGPVTSEKLRDRGIVTVGQVAGIAEAVLVSLVGRARGAPAARARAQPRPSAGARGRRRGSMGSQRALGRGPRTSRSWTRRSWRSATARAPAAGGRAALPHGHAAPPLRTSRGPRARIRCRRDGRDEDDPGHRPRPAGDGQPMIERRGITLIGLTLGNLENGLAGQLMLPVDPQTALDSVLDAVRDRYGSDSITRAVLLGRDPGLAIPLLPD